MSANDLTPVLRDSIAAERIADAITANTLDAAVLRRRLVRLAFESGDLDGLTLVDDLKRFAQVRHA